MRTKSFLSLALFFLILQISAQLPAINETKSSKIDNYDTPSSRMRSALTLKDSTQLQIQSTQDDYERVYDNLIKIKTDSIAYYSNLMKDDKYKYDLKSIDSINVLRDKKIKQLNNLIIEKNEKLATYDKFPWYLPSWKPVNRKKFFHDMYNKDINRTNYLNAFTLTGNSNGTTAQTEIVTDNLWALRVSFGSALSISTAKKEENLSLEEANQKDKEETEIETFNRLVNGGGNFYLEAALPLLTTNQNNGDQITFYSYANMRAAMDVENFNSNMDTTTANGSLGITSYLAINSDNKKFGFFVIGDINYVVGSNAFYRNLGLANEEGFLVGKFIAGFSILNTFKLSATIKTFGSNATVRNDKVMIGIQILPGF